MLLPAPTPAAFFATHLAERLARHDDEIPDDATTVWRTIGDLVAGDGEVIRASHERLVADGATPPAAAKFVMGWIGGYLAETVGFVHATTGAGVVVDATVAWRLHPEGWPDRVDLSRCPVVVEPGHPWAGQPQTRTVADLDAVRRESVHSLIDLLTPFVTACRTLAKVGSNSLWAEVADGIGAAVSVSPELTGSVGAIRDLEALLAVPGVPWRKRPQLWAACGESGEMVIDRKGGCCLAYTGPEEDWEPGEDDDEIYRLYHGRFPRIPDVPDYCSSCCFRDLADVEARRVYWADLLASRTPSVQP